MTSSGGNPVVQSRLILPDAKCPLREIMDVKRLLSPGRECAVAGHYLSSLSATLRCCGRGQLNRYRLCPWSVNTPAAPAMLPRIQPNKERGEKFSDSNRTRACTASAANAVGTSNAGWAHLGHKPEGGGHFPAQRRRCRSLLYSQVHYPLAAPCYTKKWPPALLQC